MVKLPVLLDIVKLDEAGREMSRRTVSLDEGLYSFGRLDSCSVMLDSRTVSREHFFLHVTDAAIAVRDNKSTNRTFIGDTPLAPLERVVWDMKKPIRAGVYRVEASGVERTLPVSGVRKRGGLTGPGEINRITFTSIEAPQSVGEEAHFASALFSTPIVSIAAVRASSTPVVECDYLAIGGGIGSFAWVDHLRVYGVAEASIRVVGINPRCYDNWGRYCQNSQIPLHERIRSNAISTPDNVWGFPGYASREAWQELARGNIAGVGPIFQVFGEPALSESYTPRLAHVFASLDREMARIGWSEMLIQGKAIALRKTDDGRYVLALKRSGDVSSVRDSYVVARYIHIATGYPATNFTGDLKAFRANPENADVRHTVVNAYDPHADIYQEMANSRRREVVVVRGRGIVASRIIQRLYETRRENPYIEIVHQMRSRVPFGQGSQHRRTRRGVFADVEHQPFNWPKACWGGSLRKEIEQATPEQRADFFKRLGGTSTADRRDWVEIILSGQRGGWYRSVFGNISSMTPAGAPDDRKVAIVVNGADGRVERIEADYLIDCTGLVAEVTANPFLKDLLATYSLQRNNASGKAAELRLTGIAVTNDFEIAGLGNGMGRVYAAGNITSNGPYAAVDSFLGLQYAALRSVEHLANLGTPGIARFTPTRSFSQWMRWMQGVRP